MEAVIKGMIEVESKKNWILKKVSMINLRLPRNMEPNRFDVI